MTTTQLDKLARIKATLRQCIEEASRATPGPWRITPSYYIMAGKEVVTDVFETESGSMPANALFVATARTMGPIGWQALLVAIEHFECDLSLVGTIRSGKARITLESILDLFPDTLP